MLFDPVIRMAFSDPLGKTRIFLALLLSGVLVMLYTGFLTTSSTAFYLPGYFCFLVWIAWGFGFFTWMVLTQFSLVAFYKKQAERRE